MGEEAERLFQKHRQDRPSEQRRDWETRRGAQSVPGSPLSQCDCHRALAGRREEEQRNATSAPSGRNGGRGAA